MATLPTSNPPPGVGDGGTWGFVRYAGDTTSMLCCALCLLGGILTGFGTLAFLCPMDKKDAYVLGNDVYDHKGKLLGKVGQVVFERDPRWHPTIAATAAPTVSKPIASATMKQNLPPPEIEPVKAAAVAVKHEDGFDFSGLEIYDEVSA